MSESEHQANTEATISDLLRDWIKTQIDSKFDYSTNSKRKADVQNFFDNHKDKKALENYKDEKGFERLRSSHNKILKEQLNLKGIAPQTVGLKKKTPKFYPKSTSIKANVSTSYKNIKQDSTQKPKLEGDKSESSQDKKEGDSDFKAWGNFQEEDVAAAANAFYLMIKSMYPELDYLTEDEKKRLGKLWLPFFNKYLSETWGIIIIPAIATFGILKPKISAAKDKRKAKKNKEQKEKSIEDSKSTLDQTQDHREKPDNVPQPNPNQPFSDSDWES